MKKNLILFFISICLTFFFIELLLRIFLPQDLSGTFTIQDKDGLYKNKINSSSIHSLKKRRIRYTYGKFHNREVNNFKYENNTKILMLGDSLSFGYLVNDNDTFQYKLNQKFDDYYFVNSSVPGWGTSDYTNFYKKNCKIIKPKYTFIFLNDYDLQRSINSNLYKLNDRNELISSSNKFYKSKQILNDLLVYDYLLNNSHIIQFLRTSIKLIIKNPNQIKSTNNQNKEIGDLDQKILFSKKLFLELKKISTRCNSKLIIIEIKFYKPLINELNLTYYFLNNNKKFFKKHNIYHIKLFDKESELYSNYKNYIIPSDGHPNEEAHILFYNKLANELKKILN